MKIRYIVITSVIFVLLSALFFFMRTYAPAFHFTALLAGNILMAILSVASFFIVKQQMDSRPQAFVRGVYSASLLKLMVCMFSVLGYVVVNRSHIHKPTVFVLMGIYIVYAVMETLLLSKLARE